LPGNRISWAWPATGDVRPASSALGSKGIEIFGQRGQPVTAAAGGKVVYSGSGLRGYGRLIIVKHSEEFLSAYAHNERLLVAEGTTVKPGEQIAEMGDSEAKRVMLHFEIRRDGKAVEPLKLLPRR
jgi:lipoprotein NlpD